MKKILNLVLISGLLALGTLPTYAGTNKGANPNGKPFIEIAGQIVEIEGEISSLQDQVDSLVGRVDTIEDAQAAMDTAISNLQAENLILQAAIDTNAADVNSLETQIFNLNAEIDDLQTQIDANGDADGALQDLVDANAALVTTLSASVDTLAGNLQASIDNNSILIIMMQQEIEQIEASLSMYQLLVTGTCPIGQSIRKIQPSGGVVCEIDDVGGGGAGTISQSRVYQQTQVTNGRAISDAVCPVNYVLTGGGFAGWVGNSSKFHSYPVAFLPNQTYDSNTGRTWRGFVSGASIPNGWVYSMAVCIRHN